MTSTEKHHKHPPLARPDLGEWGRNEIAILGAPCGVIKEFATQIAGAWQELSTCYVDADHTEDRSSEHKEVFQALFTDKISSRRIDTLENLSKFSRRAMLSQYDMILVNGNHFTAQDQIVLLHSAKRESLQRKLDRLTNVRAVIEIDMTLDECAFLSDKLNSETKRFRSKEQKDILSWLRKCIEVPDVKGLVLAGGKSMRMGTDKSLIEYHGKPHRQYLLELFEELQLPGFLSCRQDQVGDHGDGQRLIVDRITGLGPFGAIVSAMLTDPSSAWLVVATDLPFVTRNTLESLMAKRNPSKIATAFYNPATDFPEPLITLWEPKAYPVLLSFLAQGISCPRKTLINSDIALIQAEDTKWLTNVNTPEDVTAARQQLAH